jgi:hypothetical protein
MSAKTQIKSATRKALKASPKAKPAKQAKKVVNITYHALIVADYKASLNTSKAGASEYETFKAVLLAVDLSQTAELKAAQADIKKTFGEGMADSATIRCTMLNNARKVEFGAVVDKHQVKGAGRAALVKAVESVKSIRELRKAIAAAKPEALKDNRGGKKAPAKTNEKPASDVKHIAEGLDMPLDRKAAIEAACKVLEFVATNYLTLAENSTALTSTYATVKLLKSA